jgi:AraC-like DNA-binding protein
MNALHDIASHAYAGRRPFSERVFGASQNGPAGFTQLSAAAPTMTSSLSTIDLGDVCIHLLNFASGVHLRCPEEFGKSLIGFRLSAGAEVTQFGRPLQQRDIALAARSSLDFFSLRPSTFAWIEIDEALLAGLFRSANVRYDLRYVALEKTDTAEPVRELCRAAFSLQPTRGARPGSESLRECIVRLLRETMRASRPVAGDDASCERYRTTRRAEAFMWSRINEPLRLETVAAAVHCSPRTLLSHFARCYGVGPMGYFKMQRLNAVRYDLASGDGARKISDIACDYGFFHLGRFGTDYRAIFGETPSQTRRTRIAAQSAAYQPAI